MALDGKRDMVKVDAGDHSRRSWPLDVGHGQHDVVQPDDAHGWRSYGSSGQDRRL
jgi:hypothetical protein